MSRTTLRVEITREELISLAIAKLEAAGIDFPKDYSITTKNPDLGYLQNKNPGARVLPHWATCFGTFEEQQTAHAEGCDLDWIKITLYPGKAEEGGQS